jgi:hypothetical protein
VLYTGIVIRKMLKAGVRSEVNSPVIINLLV